MNTLLGLDKFEDIAWDSLTFRGGWFLALLLIAAAVAFAVYLYRSENRVTKQRRRILGICQVVALLFLIVIILKPTAEVRTDKAYQRAMLVLLDTSRSMGIEDRRSTPEEVAEAARALGKIEPDADLEATQAERLRSDIGQVSRLELARAALTNPEINLLDRLETNFQVRYFSFDETLRSEGDESDSNWVAQASATGESSRLGTALDAAVGRFSGQPVAGAIVLSDFSWVEGKDPSMVASELKSRGIPVYPVTFGLPAPPDIHVRGVIAPEVVFKGDRVPLRVKIESRGFEGRNVELVLNIGGVRATSRQIELQEGVQFEELMFIPEQSSGTLELDCTIDALADETTEANNSTRHRVRILDEKIKVLYVEGMPRWEYRYLRWVLLRDPRLQVTFLMTQGDPALAGASPRHIGRFPQTAKDVHQYDLIIIGDVPAQYFNAAQMTQIEEQITQRGGSLLMLAGPMAAPATYRDTPIADLLPVNIGAGQWSPVGNDVIPVVTPAGRESLATSLSLSPETSDRIWSHVRPMGYLPQLAGAKPGATVLLSLPKSSEALPDYPLVAWQRCGGSGKSLFVATEDLWRMRREVGDRYHARFWGQTIQFLTLSRLLGANKQITLETDRGTYSAGDQIQLYASVLTESFEPPEGLTAYEVIVEKKGEPDSAVTIELSDVPGSPESLLSGTYIAPEDGSYILRTRDPDAEISNTVEFEVETEPVEDRETAMQPEVARQMAELSGGRTLDMAGLAGLPADLGVEAPLSRTVTTQRDLWDTPLWFIMIVIGAGIEWYLRRKDNLV